jgi:hypothetical protein
MQELAGMLPRVRRMEDEKWLKSTRVRLTALSAKRSAPLKDM